MTGGKVIILTGNNARAKLIAGVDEVGRGCLFGEVVAAAVVLPLGKIHLLKQLGVKDSKKLTPKKREVLTPLINDIVTHWSIIPIDNITIDKVNIFNASLLAMSQAINSLSVSPSLCLVDGKYPLPNLSYPQLCLIKGDVRSPLISAASILAKVWRDNKMMEYDHKYPQYDLKKNKGYGTKKHLEAIEKYGVTPLHRLSFSPCRL